jgi:hypothetical protein
MTERTVGQPWYEVAAERIRAGEDERAVMADYGYVRELEGDECTHHVAGAEIARCPKVGAVYCPIQCPAKPCRIIVDTKGGA